MQHRLLDATHKLIAVLGVAAILALGTAGVATANLAGEPADITTHVTAAFAAQVDTAPITSSDQVGNVPEAPPVAQPTPGTVNQNVSGPVEPITGMESLPMTRWTDPGLITSYSGISAVVRGPAAAVVLFLFQVSNWLWQLIIGVSQFVFSTSATTLMSSSLNDGFTAMANLVFDAYLWAPAVILMLFFSMRHGIRGDTAKVWRLMVTVLVPLALLFAFVLPSRTAAPGTIPTGSPVWMAQEITERLDDTVTLAAAGVGSLLETVVGPTGDVSCAEYGNVLYGEFLSANDDRNSANVLLVISRMWERTFLSAWQQAQYGSSEAGAPMYCHQLEGQAGVSAQDQRLVAASAGFDNIGVGAFDDGLYPSDRKLWVLAWAACSNSSGSWTANGPFTELSNTGAINLTSHSVTDEDCNLFFTNQDSSQAQTYVLRQLDLDKTKDVEAAASTIVDREERRDMVELFGAINGENSGERMMQGLISLVTAGVYLWALIPMLLGAFIARVGLYLMLLVFPFTLALFAIPNKQGGRSPLGVKLMRITGGFLLGNVVIGLAIVLVVSLIALADAALTGVGLTSSLISGLLPIPVIVLFRKAAAAAGLGNVTSVSGAMGMSGMAGMRVAGFSEGDTKRWGRTLDRYGSRYVDQYTAKPGEWARGKAKALTDSTSSTSSTKFRAWVARLTNSASQGGPGALPSGSPAVPGTGSGIPGASATPGLPPGSPPPPAAPAGGVRGGAAVAGGAKPPGSGSPTLPVPAVSTVGEHVAATAALNAAVASDSSQAAGTLPAVTNPDISDLTLAGDRITPDQQMALDLDAERNATRSGAAPIVAAMAMMGSLAVAGAIRNPDGSIVTEGGRPVYGWKVDEGGVRRIVDQSELAGLDPEVAATATAIFDPASSVTPADLDQMRQRVARQWGVDPSRVLTEGLLHGMGPTLIPAADGFVNADTTAQTRLLADMFATQMLPPDVTRRPEGFSDEQYAIYLNMLNRQASTFIEGRQVAVSEVLRSAISTGSMSIPDMPLWDDNAWMRALAGDGVSLGPALRRSVSPDSLRGILAAASGIDRMSPLDAHWDAERLSRFLHEKQAGSDPARIRELSERASLVDTLVKRVEHLARDTRRTGTTYRREGDSAAQLERLYIDSVQRLSNLETSARQAEDVVDSVKSSSDPELRRTLPSLLAAASAALAAVDDQKTMMSDLGAKVAEARDGDVEAARMLTEFNDDMAAALVEASRDTEGLLADLADIVASGQSLQLLKAQAISGDTIHVAQASQRLTTSIAETLSRAQALQARVEGVPVDDAAEVLTQFHTEIVDILHNLSFDPTDAASIEVAAQRTSSINRWSTQTRGGRPAWKTNPLP